MKPGHSLIEPAAKPGSELQMPAGDSGAVPTRRGRQMEHEEHLRAKIVAAGEAPAVEAVRPLNPDFFTLERMRHNQAAKKRGEIRKELK